MPIDGIYKDNDNSTMTRSVIQPVIQRYCVLIWQAMLSSLLLSSPQTHLSTSILFCSYHMLSRNSPCFAIIAANVVHIAATSLSKTDVRGSEMGESTLLVFIQTKLSAKLYNTKYTSDMKTLYLMWGLPFISFCVEFMYHCLYHQYRE